MIQGYDLEQWVLSYRPSDEIMNALPDQLLNQALSLVVHSYCKRLNDLFVDLLEKESIQIWKVRMVGIFYMFVSIPSIQLCPHLLLSRC